MTQTNSVILDYVAKFNISKASETLSSTIKEELEKQNCSINDLAKVSGISGNVINVFIENPKNFIPYRQDIPKLCRALGVGVDYALGLFKPDNGMSLNKKLDRMRVDELHEEFYKAQNEPYMFQAASGSLGYIYEDSLRSMLNLAYIRGCLAKFPSREE